MWVGWSEWVLDWCDDPKSVGWTQLSCREFRRVLEEKWDQKYRLLLEDEQQTFHLVDHIEEWISGRLDWACRVDNFDEIEWLINHGWMTETRLMVLCLRLQRFSLFRFFWQRHWQTWLTTTHDTTLMSGWWWDDENLNRQISALSLTDLQGLSIPSSVWTMRPYNFVVLRDHLERGLDPLPFLQMMDGQNLLNQLGWGEDDLACLILWNQQPAIEWWWNESNVNKKNKDCSNDPNFALIGVFLRNHLHHAITACVARDTLPPCGPSGLMNFLLCDQLSTRELFTEIRQALLALPERKANFLFYVFEMVLLFPQHPLCLRFLDVLEKGEDPSFQVDDDPSHQVRMKWRSLNLNSIFPTHASVHMWLQILHCPSSLSSRLERLILIDLFHPHRQTVSGNWWADDREMATLLEQEGPSLSLKSILRASRGPWWLVFQVLKHRILQFGHDDDASRDLFPLMKLITGLSSEREGKSDQKKLTLLMSLRHDTWTWLEANFPSLIGSSDLEQMIKHDHHCPPSNCPFCVYLKNPTSELARRERVVMIHHFLKKMDFAFCEYALHWSIKWGLRDLEWIDALCLMTQRSMSQIQPHDLRCYAIITFVSTLSFLSRWPSTNQRVSRRVTCLLGHPALKAAIWDSTLDWQSMNLIKPLISQSILVNWFLLRDHPHLQSHFASHGLQFLSVDPQAKRKVKFYFSTFSVAFAPQMQHLSETQKDVYRMFLER